MVDPPGAKVVIYWRPRWIGDYSLNTTNANNLPIYQLTSIQYGCALEHHLQEVVYSPPALGPVYVLKSYTSDGFYRIALQPGDTPKPSLVFTVATGDKPLVDITLSLTMG